jgi:hypothetical protein
MIFREDNDDEINQKRESAKKALYFQTTLHKVTKCCINESSHPI